MGQPLVRFMIDPALRAGKFSVFAENIDPRTLSRLRVEEDAYLGVNGGMDSYYEVTPFEPSSGPVGFGTPEVDDDPLEPLVPNQPASDLPISDGPLWADDAAAPAAEPAPTTTEDAPASTQGSVGTGAGTCTLINVQTGQTFNIANPQVSIGRVNVEGGVVLRDPNVSRMHAELDFDGMAWSVRDLNSTNGTLVNGKDVTEALLHSGDILTIGLTDLEFQAG